MSKKFNGENKKIATAFIDSIITNEIITNDILSKYSTTKQNYQYTKNIEIYEKYRQTGIKNNKFDNAYKLIEDFKQNFEDNIKKIYFKTKNSNYKDFIDIKSITYQYIYDKYIKFLIENRTEYFPNLSSEIQITINILLDIYIIIDLYKDKTGQYSDLYSIIFNFFLNKDKKTLTKKKDEIKKILNFKKDQKDQKVSDQNNKILNIIKEYIDKLPDINIESLNDKSFNDIEQYFDFYNYRYNIIIQIWSNRNIIEEYKNELKKTKTNKEKIEFYIKLLSGFFYNYLDNTYKQEYKYLVRKYPNLSEKIKIIKSFYNNIKTRIILNIEESIFAKILMYKLVTKQYFYLNLNKKSKYHIYINKLKSFGKTKVFNPNIILYKKSIDRLKDIFKTNFELLLSNMYNNNGIKYIDKITISYEDVYNKFISFLKIHRQKYFPNLSSEVQETINILSNILLMAQLYTQPELVKLLCGDKYATKLGDNIQYIIKELPNFKTKLSSTIKVISDLISSLPSIPKRYIPYSENEIKDIEKYIRIFNLRFDFIIFIWGGDPLEIEVEDKIILQDFIKEFSDEFKTINKIINKIIEDYRKKLLVSADLFEYNGTLNLNKIKKKNYLTPNEQRIIKYLDKLKNEEEKTDSISKSITDDRFQELYDDYENKYKSTHKDIKVRNRAQIGYYYIVAYQEIIDKNILYYDLDTTSIYYKFLILKYLKLGYFGDIQNIVNTIKFNIINSFKITLDNLIKSHRFYKDKINTFIDIITDKTVIDNLDKMIIEGENIDNILDSIIHKIFNNIHDIIFKSIKKEVLINYNNLYLEYLHIFLEFKNIISPNKKYDDITIINIGYRLALAYEDNKKKQFQENYIKLFTIIFQKNSIDKNTIKDISYGKIYDDFISFLTSEREKYFKTLSSEVQETINILSDILLIAQIYNLPNLITELCGVATVKKLSDNIEYIVNELPNFKKILNGISQIPVIKSYVDRLPSIPRRYTRYSPSEIKDIEDYINIFNLRFDIIIYICGGGFQRFIDNNILKDFITDLYNKYKEQNDYKQKLISYRIINTNQSSSINKFSNYLQKIKESPLYLV